MKNQFITLLLHIAILTLFFSCKTNTPTGVNLPNPQIIDSTINSFVDNGSHPFIYTRLENMDGSVLYEHSAINSELLPNRKIDGDTWIRIWSMSKIVTITIILDLIEDGILKFDDPVSKYIPEFKDLKVAVAADGTQLSDIAADNMESACPYELVPQESVMTILHLLNHQAGFYYALTNIPCLDHLLAEKNVAKSVNTQDFIDRLAQLPLISHPGSKSYYGTNTTVLGFVAERATGKSLKQLVEERVTQPMNIKGLQYSLPDGVKLLPTISGKDSILRKANDGELDIFGPDVPDYAAGHELYLGGEGMLATADGYCDFIRMLLKKGILNDHRLLDEATVEDLSSPHTQLDNPYGYNGYNLWVSSEKMKEDGVGDAGLWIGGGYEGTHFWVDPKRGFVGVIMSQMSFVPKRGHGRDDEIRRAIYGQLE